LHLGAQTKNISCSGLLGNKNHQEYKVNLNDDDLHNNNNGGDIGNTSLTVLERAQILSYRTGIGASALLISTQAIFGDASFLEGLGVNVDGILRVVTQSQSVLPLATGATMLLCPVPGKRIVQIGTKSIGALVLASGLLSMLTSEQIFSILGIVGISIIRISICEIYDFEFEYKLECGIVMAMFPFMIDLSNHFSFAAPMCGLGLCILAAGKLFEPLKEDLISSNSEFLAK
jgi:hypothetical protein